MRVIKSPWRDIFFELVQAAEKSIKITCPFVKDRVMQEVIETKSNGAQIDLITSFKLANFYNGASDLGALERVKNNAGNVYNVQKLHSKIYVFDERQAIITSGNLTNGGLINNYEYGVLIEDEVVVNEVCNDFQQLYRSETTGIISARELADAKAILEKLPKRIPVAIPDMPDYREEENGDVLNGDIAAITETLDGWKLEVFNCLQRINKSVFETADVNKYIAELKQKYPNNNTIRDQIRKQLQYLRDIGLVEFLGRGVYRKLWV